MTPECLCCPRCHYIAPADFFLQQRKTRSWRWLGRHCPKCHWIGSETAFVRALAASHARYKRPETAVKP
jgi:ssDNA-binding Zn-finger/Zn-ribbon topoisomerase 1